MTLSSDTSTVPAADTTQASKRPVGRPTTYDPTFCDRIIELGNLGASKHEMAYEIGCGWDTFHRWQAEHGEFQDAVAAATHMSQGWWEKQGRVATFGGVPGFNAASFNLNTRNRFPTDWRDKVDQEHSGKLQIDRIERIIVDPRPSTGAAGQEHSAEGDRQ